MGKQSIDNTVPFAYVWIQPVKLGGANVQYIQLLFLLSVCVDSVLYLSS